MVKVDQARLDADLRMFANSIQAKALLIGKSSSQILKTECRRLAETLIRITPPSDDGPQAKALKTRYGMGAYARAKEKIKRDVLKKFAMLGRGDVEDYGGRYGDEVMNFSNKTWTETSSKRGHGDVKWLIWTRDYLIGVAKDYDLRAANVDGLKSIYRETKITRTGKINVGDRGRQTVLLIQKYLTKKSTVRALIRRLQANIGKLKAGWLVGWKETGGGGPGTVYNPPQWVTRHGDKGYLGGADISQIDDPSLPAVRIWNAAKNVGTPHMRSIASDALGIRLKAMANHFVNLMRVNARSPSAYQEAVEKEVSE